MCRPNHVTSLHAATTPVSHIGHSWRGASDFYRSFSASAASQTEIP